VKRRSFFKNASLTVAGTGLFGSSSLVAPGHERNDHFSGRYAKNIIFLISDGMSTGTLAMADLYAQQILGRKSNWMKLYQEQKLGRALMDTASASSIVTDSAAASSAFGGGIRVKNGVLNIGADGAFHLPVWQKFKKAGKKAGCVTTVTITHATPAGFCVNAAKRNAEPDIAATYAEIGLDILMGGGDEFFNPDKRADKKDLYKVYEQKGYQVIKDGPGLRNIQKNKPLLGVFGTGALPYSIDRINNAGLQNTPTLAEMTTVAIDHLKDHTNGFVLQVEAGKVDWAAHANDIAGLIHDQLAFDEAIKVAMAFAEKDGNTLVIITTDHGNANPGTIYDADATKKFNSISQYRYTNEYLLNGIKPDFNLQQTKDWVYEVNKIRLADEEARHLLSFYKGIEKEEGLYNYKKLPFKFYSEIQKKHNAVGWISMDHSGDYVELAMYGPGSEWLKPFVKNTDLHYLMLEAAGMEVKQSAHVIHT